MKKLRPVFLLIITLGVIASSSPTAYSQAKCSLLQVSNTATAAHAASASYWFGIMELPFLFISVFFAFLTAHAL